MLHMSWWLCDTILVSNSKRLQFRKIFLQKYCQCIHLELQSRHSVLIPILRHLLKSIPLSNHMSHYATFYDCTGPPENINSNKTFQEPSIALCTRSVLNNGDD